ncbi:MAG: hypothetical protein C0598_02050 [Marinilabiliales bacterium]|nr:MAG: hypothetical protein C0598_02050 [Marinilabiliales bacterium]
MYFLTSTAKAVTKIIPSIEGKLIGNAIRVPTPNISLVIMALDLKRETSIKEVHELVRKATLSGELVAQIKYGTSADAVSSDFTSEPYTSVFDSVATKISGDGKSIVVYVWYDNEFGYSLQVIRVAKSMANVKRPTYY